jgi:hypothetical protein
MYAFIERGVVGVNRKEKRIELNHKRAFDDSAPVGDKYKSV